LRSSGWASYDVAARRAVISAAPLPVPAEREQFERMRVVTPEFAGASVRVLKAGPVREQAPKSPPVEAKFSAPPTAL
jgi:hypothetical protein